MNKILCDTKFLQLKAYQRKDKADWVYAHRANAKDVAVIVPVVKNKEGESVLFLITRRPPIYSENKGEFCLELPAGLVGDIDKDEDILSAIKRELKEESGYIADEIKIVTKNVASSAGALSETSTIAIAYIDADKKFDEPSDNDGGVIVRKVLVKKDEIINYVRNFENKGNSIGAQTICGLFFYFLINKFYLCNN